MEVVIVPDNTAVGELGAAKIASVAAQVGPEVVLGLATGSSPISAYRALARRVRNRTLNLSRASAFALDEYVGLPTGHPQSYRSVISHDAAAPLGLAPDRVHTPNGFASDLSDAAIQYEELIRLAGGVDIQVLGVGANGHIGFNEPGSSLASRTRVKTLANRTRQDNARFFEGLESVPRHCLTQGLGTIMDARHVLLLAQGSAKAEAISALVEGPITTMWPGSILQMHEHATIVIDEAAGRLLRLADYYKEAYSGKPDWQGFA